LITCSLAVRVVHDQRTVLDAICRGDRELAELVPWSEIGKIVGVETPIINAIVDIYGVIHEKDWRVAGRGSAELGLDGMSVEAIKRYLRIGERDGQRSAVPVRTRSV
jgi:hypothetical protein